MELLYILLVILVVTRFGGELALRLGEPALVGELVGGVLLGVIVHEYEQAFPVLSELSRNDAFLGLTDLGVFFLMLLAGLEMQPRSLASASRGALAVAGGGIIVPFACGWGLGWIWIPASDWKVTQAMFLGTAFAITAIPVAAKVFMDLDRIESPAARTAVSAAVLDDAFGLILLAVLTALLETGTLPTVMEVAWLVARVVLFFLLCTLIGVFLLPRLAHWFRQLWIDEIEFSLLLIVALGFALLAEILGLHFIIGAFLAGLFFTHRTLTRRVFDDVKGKASAVTTGFLAPMFFASTGYHLDISALYAVPTFVIVIVVAAILSKMVGAGLAARWAGLGQAEAMEVGVAMSGRGAVELVVAEIAQRAGLFSRPDPTPAVVEQLFSAVVIMAIATTLFMPIAMRFVARHAARPRR